MLKWSAWNYTTGSLKEGYINMLPVSRSTDQVYSQAIYSKAPWLEKLDFSTSL